MILLDKLREMLERNEPKIKVRGEISGNDWAEISMTNTKGEPIKLGTPITDVHIRIQTLTSGAVFLPKEYRIDNCHDGLHQHSGGSVSFLADRTMSGALMALLGKEYEVLENQSFSN